MPKNPHLQTFFIFVICAVVVGAAACYVYGIPRFAPAKTTFGNSINTSAKNTKTSAANNMVTNTDWKKDFLASSATYGSAAKTTKSVTAKKPTGTDQFGRDVLSEYLKLKQAGLNSSTTIADNLSYTILSKDYATAKPKQYTTSNLKTTLGNDALTLKQYGNQLGAAMKAYSAQYDDAAVLLSSLKNQDQTYTTKIAANLKNYRALLTQLLTIPVPPTLVQNHLDLVNGVSNMIYIDSTIALIKTDPIQTMNGLTLYSNTTIPLFVSSIGAIKDAFRNAHVSFAAGESGSYFKLN